MTEPTLPTDAIMWSAPERERADRPLIVLLHGYGSHEGDLFALSPALPLTATIASLRAPRSAGPGFAWWDAYPVLKQRYSDGIASDRPQSYWWYGDLACLVISAGPLLLSGLLAAGVTALSSRGATSGA